MTGGGKYIPRGFAPLQPQGGKPLVPIQIPFDVLRRLPGVIEWGFECFRDSTAIANGNPITNVTPGVPINFQVEDGFEGLIDWLSVGPNMNPSTAAGTWNASLTINGVHVPGLEFFGRLKEFDGFGTWWVDTLILVPENGLIELRKESDSFGVNPTTIGGRVHGLTWPIRSRLDWELTHPEK